MNASQQRQYSAQRGAAPNTAGYTPKTGYVGGFANAMNTATQGIQNVINPISNFSSSINQGVGAIQNVIGLGKSIVGGFKSLFGLDKEEKEAQAKAAAEAQRAREQRLVDERNQMMSQEVDDQQRRAEAQQYSMENSRGTVEWVTDPDGTRRQVSQMDEYGQKMKSTASDLVDNVADVDKYAQDATDSIMSQYDRMNNERNNESLREVQINLMNRGIREDSPAWRAAMKREQDRIGQERANAFDSAVTQGYQIGSDQYKNAVSGWGAMNSFVDPSEMYKEMAGASAYGQSSVQSAWQHSAGREDAREQADFARTQLAQQDTQFYAGQQHDMSMQERRIAQENYLNETKQDWQSTESELERGWKTAESREAAKGAAAKAQADRLHDVYMQKDKYQLQGGLDAAEQQLKRDMQDRELWQNAYKMQQEVDRDNADRSLKWDVSQAEIGRDYGMKDWDAAIASDERKSRERIVKAEIKSKEAMLGRELTQREKESIRDMGQKTFDRTQRDVFNQRENQQLTADRASKENLNAANITRDYVINSANNAKDYGINQANIKRDIDINTANINRDYGINKRDNAQKILDNDSRERIAQQEIASKEFQQGRQLDQTEKDSIRDQLAKTADRLQRGTALTNEHQRGVMDLARKNYEAVMKNAIDQGHNANEAAKIAADSASAKYGVDASNLRTMMEQSGLTHRQGNQLDHDYLEGVFERDLKDQISKRDNLTKRNTTTQDVNARKAVANLQWQSQNLSSKRDLEGKKYTSDNQKKASKFASQMQYDAALNANYQKDLASKRDYAAREYASDSGLMGSNYATDKQLEGTMYAKMTDANIAGGHDDLAKYTADLTNKTELAKQQSDIRFKNQWENRFARGAAAFRDLGTGVHSILGGFTDAYTGGMLTALGDSVTRTGTHDPNFEALSQENRILKLQEENAQRRANLGNMPAQQQELDLSRTKALTDTHLNPTGQPLAKGFGTGDQDPNIARETGQNAGGFTQQAKKQAEQQRQTELHQQAKVQHEEKKAAMTAKQIEFQVNAEKNTRMMAEAGKSYEFLDAVKSAGGPKNVGPLAMKPVPAIKIQGTMHDVYDVGGQLWAKSKNGGAFPIENTAYQLFYKRT